MDVSVYGFQLLVYGFQLLVYGFQDALGLSLWTYLLMVSRAYWKLPGRLFILCVYIYIYIPRGPPVLILRTGSYLLGRKNIC